MYQAGNKPMNYNVNNRYINATTLISAITALCLRHLDIHVFGRRKGMSIFWMHSIMDTYQ
jgi:hypothetical protein